MNMKTVLGIIGAALVIGGVIYLVKKFVVDNKVDAGNDEKASTTEKAHEIVRSQGASEAESNLNAEKADAAERISERHEEAKQVMKDAVNTIYDDFQPESTKNDEAFKKMSEELDNL